MAHNHLHQNRINLIGAVISRAIIDLNTKVNWQDKQSARDFLFKKGHLEAFLSIHGLGDDINADFIRRTAKNPEIFISMKRRAKELR